MSTKSIFLSCLCLWVTYFAQAQVPQLISYQAVARDVTGKVLSEKAISVQVEILQGSSSGSVAYAESHALTTTKAGTINLLIGGGNAINGTFANIDWSNGPYFMKLSMKQDKETEYKEVSNTQMISVPYALYAEKAGTVVNGGNSGGETSTTGDFVLVPFSDGSDNNGTLVPLLEGNFVKETNYSLYFNYYVLYVDSKDQDVKLTISGVPEGSYEIRMSKGSDNGRSIYARIGNDEEEGFILPKGTYDVTFTLTNKYGIKKEYKCTLIYTKE